ncbi:hypothetical protein [Candidatus Borrelia fainii]|uniref:hypothetical protein n=1 Tax=Candidatus Borrelia fainii TaxID=2518322 RepID=UPI002493C2E3|nr:hypothetical protein [Candidatus Borrelia fainii]
MDNYANLNSQLEKYRLVYEEYIQYLNDYDNFVSKEKLHKDSKEKCEKMVDDIDSGIGGESGKNLGKYLKKLSKNMQIFVVTHLDNIANLSNYHILVKKEYTKDRTYVHACLLLDNDRVSKVARMFSGNVNDIIFQHEKSF